MFSHSNIKVVLFVSHSNRKVILYVLYYYSACTIRNTKFKKTILDLGASINVIPYSIYVILKLGSLKETDIVI